MEYRLLGKSGLKVSELSFGSWITFGESLDLEGIKQCMRIAFEAGVNYFDNAESYGSGAAELLMGEVIRDYRRRELVISTKLFWGGKSPNSTGLSWKHLIEGTQNSLRRLQLDYVDLLLCHRPDPETPIEETVRAMDVIIRQGLAFYWGTSEWSADQIEEAHRIAKEVNAIPPLVEQPEYNMFNRERVEKEYEPLFEKYKMGLATWGPLESGILTGKYNKGIPTGTRFHSHPELADRITEAKIAKVKELAHVANKLNCTLSQLAIAWCLKNSNVSTVLTGATSTEQVLENMKARSVKERLTDDVMQVIENILQGQLTHA